MAKKKQQVTAKIQLGKCPFCDKDILGRNERGETVRSSDYRDFWVLLSDGSRMKVGVCDTCREGLTDEHINVLMAEHRVFWQKGLVEAYEEKKRALDRDRDSQIEHYSNLRSLRFAKREHDLD